MKRTNVLLVLWAIGGISLAVLFFVAVHREGIQSGHLGRQSDLLLLACILWNALLHLLMRAGSRHGSK